MDLQIVKKFKKEIEDLSNQALEMQVLGEYMSPVDDSVRPRILERLDEECFTHFHNKTVFRMITAYPGKNLAEYMGMAKEFKLTKTSILDFVMNRDNYGSMWHEVDSYINQLIDLKFKRKSLEGIDYLAQKIASGTNVSDMFKDFKEFYESVQLKSEGTDHSLKSAYDAYIADIKNPTSYVFAWEKLNNASGGMRPGQVVVVGGFPMAGKSWLVLNQAVFDIMADLKVLFFSVEMTKASNYARIFQLLKDYNGAQHEQDLESKLLENKNFQLYDEYSDVDKIISEIIRQKMTKGVDIVYIDHIHEITSESKHDERERIDYIAKSFRRLAIELGIVIVLVSQLKRTKVKNDNDIDQDLFLGSSAINQVAHLALIISRPNKDFDDDWGENLDKEETHIRALHVVKNRGVVGINASTGKMLLKFEKGSLLVEAGELDKF